MLADRLGTTLAAAQAELEELKSTRGKEKALAKAVLTASLARIDADYARRVKPLRVVVRAMEAEAVTPEPPAE